MNKELSDEGCTCQECGNNYKVDILLPDILWNEITDKNLLCGNCILGKLEEKGFDYWELRKPIPNNKLEFDILNNDDIELEVNGTFTPNELHECIKGAVDLNNILEIPVRVKLRDFDTLTVSQKERVEVGNEN